MPPRKPKNNQRPDLHLAPAPAPEAPPAPETNPLDGTDVVLTAEQFMALAAPQPEAQPVAAPDPLVPVPFRGRILYVTQSTLQSNVVHFALLGLAIPQVDQTYFAAGIILNVDGKQVFPEIRPPAEAPAPPAEAPPVEG